MTENRTESARRDPLTMSFEAHRRILLLRLQWRASATRRERAQTRLSLRRVGRGHPHPR